MYESLSQVILNKEQEERVRQEFDKFGVDIEEIINTFEKQIQDSPKGSSNELI